jgi:hypothetical protein
VFGEDIQNENQKMHKTAKLSTPFAPRWLLAVATEMQNQSLIRSVI